MSLHCEPANIHISFPTFDFLCTSDETGSLFPPFLSDAPLLLSHNDRLVSTTRATSSSMTPAVSCADVTIF